LTEKSESKGQSLGLGEEETNDLYNLISEALTESEQNELDDWDEDISVHEFDENMDQARKFWLMFIKNMMQRSNLKNCQSQG